MFHFLIFLLVSHSPRFILMDHSNKGDFGDDLVSKLKNEENIDLSEDAEYEELRSEFLAYHTVLETLGKSRRSLISTPCANVGGICINYKLCPGYRQLAEIPGCKSKLNVCCFVWNIYNVRDQKEHGIENMRFPWSNGQIEFGGKGVEQIKKKPKKKSKKKLNKKPKKTDSAGKKSGSKVADMDDTADIVPETFELPM